MYRSCVEWFLSSSGLSPGYCALDHWQNCSISQYRVCPLTTPSFKDWKKDLPAVVLYIIPICLKYASCGNWRTLQLDLSGLLGHISSGNVLRHQYASSEMPGRWLKSFGNLLPLLWQQSGFDLLSELSFFIFHTTISVTFQMNNLVQHYEYLSWEIV